MKPGILKWAMVAMAGVIAATALWWQWIVVRGFSSPIAVRGEFHIERPSLTIKDPNVPIPDISLIKKDDFVDVVLPRHHATDVAFERSGGIVDIAPGEPAKFDFGGSLELTAVAIHYPKAATFEELVEGGFSRVAEESTSLNYRTPISGEWSSGENSNGQRPPKELLEIATYPFSAPEVHLLLHRKNWPYLQLVSHKIWDARTLFQVSTSDRWEQPIAKSVGDWTRVSIPVSIWHATPLKIGLLVHGGLPIESALELNPNFQEQIDTNLRIQTVFAFEGIWEETKGEYSAAYHRTSANGWTALFRTNGAAGRMSNALSANGEMCWMQNQSNQLLLAQSRVGSLAGVRECRFLQLPSDYMLNISLPASSELPKVDNLLDVRMSQFNLITNDKSLMNTAALIAQLELVPPGRHWFTHAGRVDAESFSGVTPRDLIKEYSKRHPNHHVRIDSREHKLVITEVIPWNERWRNWWDRHNPF